MSQCGNWKNFLLPCYKSFYVKTTCTLINSLHCNLAAFMTLRVRLEQISRFFHTVNVVGAQNKSSSRLLSMLWYFTHYSLQIPKSFGGLFFLNVNNLLKRWKLQKRFFNIFSGVTSDALFSFQKQKRHYMYVVFEKKLVQFKIREKFGNTSSLFLK